MNTAWLLSDVAINITTRVDIDPDINPGPRKACVKGPRVLMELCHVSKKGLISDPKLKKRIK